MSERIISTTGLQVETNGFMRLKNTSIHLTAGLTCITGPSGSGKSTLLKTLVGITVPTKGKVSHYGANQNIVYQNEFDNPENLGRRAINWLRLDSPQQASDASYRSKRLGYIPQKPHVPAGLTAIDYLLKPHMARGNQIDREYLKNLTDRLDITHLLGKQAVTLSGGELQRVTVAFALAHKPNIVFADEPTAALDSASSQMTMRLFKELAVSEDLSVVCVTHNQAAIDFANTEIQLTDNRVSAVNFFNSH